ncbi:MAG: polysaccharide deacetylase family protein [Phycisphaerales bacterium]|nr:polysaccharide deacetylase family protein [Phycisphaerales bacterium]
MLQIVHPNWFLRRIIYPSYIYNFDRSQPYLYLTFDDGPTTELTPFILKTLAQYNVQATFFCVGHNLAKYEELHQAIVEQKHTIANHSFNHVHGLKNKTEDFLDNVALFETVQASNLFRPPYGLLKHSQIKKLLCGAHPLHNPYKIILGDVIPYDFDAHNSTELCWQRIVRFTQNGSIIILHDNKKAQDKILNLLPRMIRHFLEKGFQFKVIS